MAESRMTRPAAPVQSRRPKADLILYLIVALTWVSIWRIQDMFPILGKIQLPILIQLSTLGLFIAIQDRVRNVKWLRSPLMTIAICLIAIMVIGLPFSLYPGIGFTFITRDFVPCVLAMVMVGASLRESSDLEWFAFAHLIGGLIYTAYVYKYCPVGADGRLGNLVFYDANDFALIMVCTLPFAVYFMRPGMVWWKRLTAVVAVGLFVVMIMRSGSRGGFLGLIAVSLYILLRYQAVPTRLRVGAVAVGLLVMMAFSSDQYWNMMRTLLKPNDDYNMTGETGRKAIWKRGIGYMVANPILGVGIRAFPQAEATSPIGRRYAAIGRGFKWSVAHNSFVEIGAECGFPALLLFVSMLGAAIRSSSLKRKSKERSVITPADRAFGQTLTAAFVGFIVSGFFVSAEYFAYLYVLFGLVMAQQAILLRRVELASPADPIGPPVRVDPRKGVISPPGRPRGHPETRPRGQRPQWQPTGF